MEMLKVLWACRGFILGSVKREFQSRYRNSLLGGTWAVLNCYQMAARDRLETNRVSLLRDRVIFPGD
jgi:hypothetical protein